MSIYENLTNQQIREILDEAAKDQPYLLTRALRNNGNFVYLIVPEDIVTHDQDLHDGELKITEDEAKETMIEFADNLDETIDYSTICSAIVDYVQILRDEKKRKEETK